MAFKRRRHSSNNTYYKQKTHRTSSSYKRHSAAKHQHYQAPRKREQRRGVCTLVKKGLIVVEHDLMPRSAIEHVATEIVVGKRKKRTSIMIVNLYSNPRQRKQKFKALIQKTKQIAGDNINIIAGDFNAQHKLWGYPEINEKGKHLLDDMTEMGYQLINDLETTTRNALTSTQRDTNPDLTFLGETTRPLRAKWRNTEETLGSDHKILEIVIPFRGNIKESRQQHIVDWHDYRQTLEANGPETIEDIEAWANLLNGTIQSATQTVNAEAEGVQIDSRLAHLMEARNSLKKRWKQQRHNRKLRKRIAQLNVEIEKHSKVVCRQQWHAVCQEADGQLHKGKTWKLLRHLLDEQHTKGTQQYILNRTLHKAVTEMGEEEVKKRLNTKYLPETPTDPTGDGGEIPKVKALKVLGLRLRDKGSNEKTLVNELQTKIEADREAHALTRRGLPSSLPDMREADPTEAKAENANSEEFAITKYGEVLQWYRASRNKYPPPHRDLTRKEATTFRQLQARAIWTSVWAKHVCPEIYHTDTCQRCKKARATQSHILWECSPPAPNTQDIEMPDKIGNKITSTDLETQRAVVQHVLELLDRQKPETSSRSRGNV
ncbi:hypothetical protein HPB50_012741 [Hyalomma asiaticum]|uniref:Uncharacterized protein n=1 Tax=Hyalomma asiaticum TaxID=266040 RepID=A0ACB7TH73_HYAAI|nr:hypothetical protein HPB50_012741 [Hyalomma asiaticum]